MTSNKKKAQQKQALSVRLPLMWEKPLSKSARRLCSKKNGRKRPLEAKTSSCMDNMDKDKFYRRHDLTFIESMVILCLYSNINNNLGGNLTAPRMVGHDSLQ